MFIFIASLSSVLLGETPCLLEVIEDRQRMIDLVRSTHRGVDGKGGHFGKNKIAKEMTRSYFYPNMWSLVGKVFFTS